MEKNIQKTDKMKNKKNSRQFLDNKFLLTKKKQKRENDKKKCAKE